MTKLNKTVLLNEIKKLFKETNLQLILTCICLSLFGVVFVSSATYDGESIFSRDMGVMIFATLLGLAVSLFMSLFDYDIIFKLWFIVAGGCLFLMFLLLTPLGVAPEGREDATSWLKFGSFFFQPSEILKIGFIVTFSYHLSKIKNDLVSLKNIFFLCLHAAVPILLVIGTGDMGSALIFVIMFIGMMFISGVHWLYFPAGALIVLAASPFIWLKVFDNIQRDRFLALFDPDSYPAEIWQQSQAINAIKAGGFTGSGLFKGEYTHSGMVPECENDMIFSVVCEEKGFIGAIILLALFVFLTVKIIQIGKGSKNYAAEIMCYGIAFMIIAQVVINIGMCLMLLPVIGITLPFISAGGSSTICLYVAMGLALSVHRSAIGLHEDNYHYAKITR